MTGPGSIIALIGPRGAGKSTVARLLSERLGLPLMETDAMVEKSLGRSIASIFGESGEDLFRAAERAALAAAVARGPAVISTGGGVVSSPENRKLLVRETFAVYLRASPAILYRRICRDPATSGTRPPLTGLHPLEEMAAVASGRDPLYRECARLEIDTGGAGPGHVCSLIIEALGKVRPD